MTIPGYVVPGQIVCPLIEKDEGILIRKYQPGHGVVAQSFGSIEAIVATVVGKVNVVSLDGNSQDDEITVDEDKPNAKSKLKELCFQVNIESKIVPSTYKPAEAESSPSTRVGTSVLPEVGDIVYARVTRLTLTQAHLEILVVENQGTVSAESGKGIHASAEGVVALPRLNAGQSAGAAANNSNVGEGFGAIIRIQDVRATERDKVKIQQSFKPGDIVRASVISLGDGTNYYLSTVRNDLGVVFAHSAAGERMYPVDWQTMKCAVTGATELRKCAKPF